MGVFSFEGVEIKEAPEDVTPRCPKCEEKLTEIWIKTKGIGLVELQASCQEAERFVEYFRVQRFGHNSIYST